MSNDDFMHGYMQGDNERQWLAIANSELRSRILELEQQLQTLEAVDDVSVDDLDSYCGAWWLGWPAILCVWLAHVARRSGHVWRSICIRIWFHKVSLETWIARAFTRMAGSNERTGRNRHPSGRRGASPTPGDSSDHRADDNGRLH